METRLKTCPHCQQEKSLEEFYKFRGSKDGHTCWCRQCIKEAQSKRKQEIAAYQKEYRKSHRQVKYKRSEQSKEHKRQYKRIKYALNKESLKEKQRQYWQSPKGKFVEYRNSAKKKGVKFNLSFEQFMTFWQKPCSYSNHTISTVGIDRLDNSSGYEIGNCVPCCSICNKMKLNLTLEEFKNHIKCVLTHLEDNYENGTSALLGSMVCPL